jgi:hypothetical protein
MITARAAYVTTSGDLSIYRVEWSDGRASIEMNVRVERGSLSAAEQMREALEVARKAAAKLAATPDNSWSVKSFFSDDYLPPAT